MRRSSRSTFPLGDLIAVTVVLMVVAILTAVVFGFLMNRDVSSNGLPPEDTDKIETNDPTDPVKGTDPVTDLPQTDPATDPATEPPATTPVVTDPPETEPPATEPPATDPPETAPPAPVVSDELLNLTDFSFLGNLKREMFADAAKDGDGSWYQGQTTRNLTTGEVTHAWDRYKSTLDILDAYGGIYRKNTDQKVTYLTFDTGYDNGTLSKVLDVLKEKDVKAIFFCTGDFLNEKNAAIIRRITDEGHLLGNHSATHKNFLTLTDKQLVEEIRGFEEQLKGVLGSDYSRTAFLRAPNGAASERDLAIAQKMGYQTVFWSYTYKDYDVNNQRTPADALRILKSGLHDGCVYLLHTVSTTNAEILGDFIDYARAEGYEIRRIDQ